MDAETRKQPGPATPPSRAAAGPGRKFRLPAILGKIIMACFGSGVLLTLLGGMLCGFDISQNMGEKLIVAGLVASAAVSVVTVIVPIAFVGLGFIFTLLSLAKSFMWGPKTLFLKAQMRLTDLVLIVVLLGNAEGALFAWADLGMHTPLFAALSAVWILSGAAWGTWVATVQEIDNP